MINSFQDFQEVSKIEMNGYMQAMGEWNKSWQAIAAEMTDYTKRWFEDGVATLQKIASAKSVPEALEIQTNFAKRAREDYMQQAAKIGVMYQDLASDSFKPIQRIMRGSL